MKSEQIEKHQPTRKWTSSKYSSIEMPRYDNCNNDDEPYGMKAGKLRPPTKRSN